MGTSLGNPRSNATIVRQTFSSFSATQLISSSNPVNIPTNVGWYVDFQSTGERINIDPQLAMERCSSQPTCPTARVCGGWRQLVLPVQLRLGRAGVGRDQHVVAPRTGAEIAGFTLISLVAAVAARGAPARENDQGDRLRCRNGQTPTNSANIAQTNSTVRRVGWREVPQ